MEQARSSCGLIDEGNKVNQLDGLSGLFFYLQNNKKIIESSIVLFRYACVFTIRWFFSWDFSWDISSGSIWGSSSSWIWWKERNNVLAKYSILFTSSKILILIFAISIICTISSVSSVTEYYIIYSFYIRAPKKERRWSFDQRLSNRIVAIRVKLSGLNFTSELYKYWV